MQKNIKIILICLSIIFLAIGQIFIVNFHNYKSGIVFSVLFVIFLLAAITEAWLVAWKKIQEWSNALSEMTEKSETTQNGKKDLDLVKPAKEPVPGKEVDPYFRLKIEIPKFIFIIMAGIFAVVAQVFLFSQNFKVFAAVLFLGIFFFAIFLRMKERKATFKFKFNKGLLLYLLIAGILFLIIGWVLLLNRVVMIQKWGVFFTTIGILATFFGLPENEEGETRTEDRKILLFSEFRILDNILVKVILLVAAFTLTLIGNRLIGSTNVSSSSMVSWGFYLGAAMCVFFAMPLLKIKEEYKKNKILDIIKLAAVLIALLIAYNGQKSFVSGNAVNAVHMYLLAAFIIIFASPIYMKQDNDELDIPLYVEWIFLAVIFGIGVYLRFYEIQIRPFGIENDEVGGFLGHLMDVLNGKAQYNVGNNGINFNISNFFISIFGVNRVSMKLMAVAIGIISIPIVYFFIRKTINKTTAIFVTTIFVFLRIIIHYSRSAHATLMSTLVICAAIYFLVNATRKNDKASYFISGMCFGLGWHTIMTIWFITVVPFVYWMVKVFTTRGYFKKNLIGLVSFCLGLWIFTSMIVHNYFLNTNMYFSRIHEVSVFSGDYNAPKNVAAGIVDNTKRVMLMYNYQGDSRERNSGGKPFEPTIDFTSSIFFFLGLIYCAYYSKYYLFFIFILLFYSQAAGSIFSIEAPSAMRAFGTMIAAIFFIGVMFDRVWKAFLKVFGNPWRKVIFPVLVFIPLFFIAKDNYNQYFNRWIGGLDELSTAAGMYSQELGKTYRIFLATSQYYPGHPPFKFFRDFKVNHSPDGLDIIRDMCLINDENYGILFHSDEWAMLPYWQMKFPGAKAETITHRHFVKSMKSDAEGFGKFFDSLLISNADIQAKRGLTGLYDYKNGSKQTVNNDALEFAADNANKAPYKVTWDGDVYIPLYGDGYFMVSGHAGIKLFIDNRKIEIGTTYKFARGLHKIKVEAVRETANDTFGLSLNVKKLEGSRVTGEENYNITKNYLYANIIDGLHGYFYTGKKWDKGPIVKEEITPYLWFTGFLNGYFPSVKWQGYLKVDKDGQYKLNSINNGYMRIVIDKKYYWESGVDGDANDYFKDKKMQLTPAFNLKKGKHFIEIYVSDASIIQVSWDQGQNHFVPLGGDMLEPDLLISE